ncbi:hypothetical protein ACRRTK_012274 [Alexandromys fortis]
MKTFRNISSCVTASFRRTSGNEAGWSIPQGTCLVLGERFQVDSIFKNPFLEEEKGVFKIIGTF